MAIKPKDLFELLKEDVESQTYPGFVKDAETPMWPDMTLREASCYSIIRSFLKKEESGMNDETRRHAFSKFMKVNERCALWEPPTVNTWTEELLGCLKQAVWDFWHEGGLPLISNEMSVLHLGGVGPGVSLGSKGNSFYAKLFSSPLSCASSVEQKMFETYITEDPVWAEAEKLRSSSFGSIGVAESNRLSFVPKNDEVSRTICVESTIGGYFQSAIARVLERRLARRFGISVSEQPFVNRHLAYLGSVNDDMVTLDLSSASDSISVAMLRWLLPRDFYDLLMRHRARSFRYEGKDIALNMVSTMGNGYTFPLQTAIFACVVRAAYHRRGLPLTRSGRGSTWSVFGDDIICHELAARDVILLLDILGFSLNMDKSFVKGPFRESCGEDYFNGVNIRGVYVKHTRTQQARYSVINRLIQFSTRTGIFLPRTVGRLLRTVDFLPVPGFEDESSGILCPLRVAYPYLGRNRSTWAYSYKCWVAKAAQYRIGDNLVFSPRGAKGLVFNPDGFLVSLLQGGISCPNGKFLATMGYREYGDPKYKKKRRNTSMWDIPPGDVSHLAQRWNTAAQFYLERG